ncbi:hypothetical protein [Candidatus Bathycorpusculum sp.]|uniref:hypothetical protein n=1 Tax=Candidatus Bathycorpusculum sp. TaxID=2994959 RepID=UPI00281F43C3|nr:hypothetical protein [Candidatus Termitimicrobium sp.]MCL2685707.1 hypothetical protein [Candidatus Termitimicrobium sp.]
MSETQQKKKRKKKANSLIETEQVESELLPELVTALDELAKEKKYLDIQVCPKCKSPRVKRVNTMAGDLFSHMGLTPPSHECSECNWRGQMVLKATNKPTTVRDVVIMAEANKLDTENKTKKLQHQPKN